MPQYRQQESQLDIVEEWGDTGDCTEMFPDGMWKPLNCERSRPFACQRVEIGIPSAVGMVDGKPKVSHTANCGGKCTLKRCRSTCERLDQMWRDKRDFRKYRARQKREYERMEQFERRYMGRMTRIRRRKPTKLEHIIRKWSRKKDQAANVYPWISTALTMKLDGQRRSGHLDERRYLMDQGEGESVRFIASVMRCKVVDDGEYEFCVDYNGDDYLSLTVKLSTDENGETLMNVIESDIERHFEEYQFDFDTLVDSRQCSEFIDGSSIRMCVETTIIDGISGVQLYIMDGSDGTNVTFDWDIEQDWNAVETMHLDESMEWIKKCNHQLHGVSVCIEQFDAMHFKGSLKMSDRTTERKSV